MKQLTKAILLLVLILGVQWYTYESNSQEITKEDNLLLYQGPVPLGYDLEHFRNTGKTIREGKLNG